MKGTWLSTLLAALAPGCAAPAVTEFVNISFTPSVDTSGYSTWTFDLTQCSAPSDTRVDGGRLHVHLLRAIERELVAKGYARTDDGADFVVYYEVEIVPGTGAVQEQGRGRIFIQDTATGRRVWRGERRAPLRIDPDDAKAVARLDRFVHELLQYTGKLKPLTDDA